MFTEKHPLAWSFHKNTCLSPNVIIEKPGDFCPEPAFKEYFGVPVLSLPEPVLPDISLKKAIEARFSCRHFTGDPLTLLQLATILKAGYGILERSVFRDFEWLERPVPSGGGLYPMEVYLIILNVQDAGPGIHHYAALHHTLEQIGTLPQPGISVSRLFMGQPYIMKASAIIILTAMLERTLWKYKDRGYRYILFEAGHVAQNINLAAGALGLASLNLGGFYDSDVTAVFHIDPEIEVPLYAIAIGVPSSGERNDLRQP